MCIITRARIVQIILSVVPYAPSTIVDAVAGFTSILVEYSPLSPEDDADQVIFAFAMKMLNECYCGASPRDVFMDMIRSMANDLLQPFPSYDGVYDQCLRTELIRELSFRWSLYTNVLKHLKDAKKPEMSVQELEDYFHDLDACVTQTSSDASSSDVASIGSNIEDSDCIDTSREQDSNTEPTASTPTDDAATIYVPSPSRKFKYSAKDVERTRVVCTINEESNGHWRNSKRVRLKRPLSYYRTFFAEWKNCLENRTPVKLLLFRGRKPSWKKLSEYDVTIPWREKM